MSRVSVAIASVDPTWAWQDRCRITFQSPKWPFGQFTMDRQTPVWSIRPQRGCSMMKIKWEIWLQIQEGPVVLHSGHGPSASTSASLRRWAATAPWEMRTKFAEWRPTCFILIWTKYWTWVQGDICCAGSLGPYHTSLVQTCRDHLSRVKFIVVFQYLCSFFLSPQIYLRLPPCVRTLNTGWLVSSVHCSVNPGKSTFRNGDLDRKVTTWIREQGLKTCWWRHLAWAPLVGQIKDESVKVGGDEQHPAKETSVYYLLPMPWTLLGRAPSATGAELSSTPEDEIVMRSSNSCGSC